MMLCLNCGAEYIGDPRSYYCGTRCRKRAENSRARLKRLMADYPATIRKMEQAAAAGDTSRANRAKARAHRVIHQIENLEPVFTREQRWLNTFYSAIGRFL
jgi:hypothetical protein